MEEEEEEGNILGMVFEPWISPQMYTNHAKKFIQVKTDEGVMIRIKQEKFIHEERFNQETNQTQWYDDTGCVFWDDSLVLASYLNRLVRESKTSLGNVLELGSGTGTLGLYVSLLDPPPLRVVLSDRSNLGLIKRNISKNVSNCPCVVVEHSWGENISLVRQALRADTADTILVAGCIYHKESITPMMASLKAFSRPLLSDDVNNTPTRLYLAIEFRFKQNEYNSGKREEEEEEEQQQQQFMLPVLEKFLEILRKTWNLHQIETKDLGRIQKSSVRIYQGFRRNEE